MIDISEFDRQNFNQKCISIINKELQLTQSEEDRFGIFYDGENKINIHKLSTTKSFAEITDQTAKKYKDKNIAVCWSGGIDSSLIVAALHKNNIPFKVTVMHNRCKFENPDLYEWVLENCEIISLKEETKFNNLYEHLTCEKGTIITGNPADQLFPSIRYNLLLSENRMKEMYSRETGYGNFIEEFNKDIPDYLVKNNIVSYLENTIDNLYGNFPKNFKVKVIDNILNVIDRNNLELVHFYQLKWLAKFIFKYHRNLKRLTKTIKNDIYNNHKVLIEDFEEYDFFDTLDYQAWAWTNLDKNFELYSTTALSYKTELKEYIRDVTGLYSQLNLIKMPSL